MRKVAITLTLLAVRMSFTFGQTDPDAISIKKFWRLSILFEPLT